jgi:hypothetical protein
VRGILSLSFVLLRDLACFGVWSLSLRRRVG